MKRHLAWTVVLLAVLAGATAAWIARWRTDAQPMLEVATLFDAGRPLAAFELTDQNGRKFIRESLRGQWTMMFFGFTHCPDVCPTTLATLSELHRMLSDLPLEDQPVVVLVSVDPVRDTPAVLARYVAHFDPQFLGVTGPPEAIEILTRDLGVAVSIGPASEDGNYTVDHTAAIFLIDPSAEYSAVFSGPHAADVIARDYRSIVAAAS